MRVAIIPARGGSVRIPNKNRRIFHGKPIIWYSISTAFESRLFDKVFVSTEDSEIGEVAADAGAEIIHRPADLATNETGTQAVMRNALNQIQGRYGPVEMACCIYATSPMMTTADLAAGLLAAKRHHDQPYAFSVGQDPLRDAGNWYWGSASAFLSGTPVHDQFSVMVPIPTERCCDINTPEDWEKAEAMYAALHQDDKVAYG